MRDNCSFVELAKKLYGLENYVRGDVITVDQEGYLVINIGNSKIKIKELLDSLKLDIAYIRVLPLIERAMKLVYKAYKYASEAVGYKGTLIPLYPMKVNPLPVIVEAIFKYGESYNWGFNAGSIGEVKLLRSLSSKWKPRMLIYDGVVTENVLEELVALKKQGWRVVVDVQSEHDAEILLKYPEVEVGLRIKPVVKLHGKWSSSVGLSSKFGITMNIVEKLLSDFKWLRERATVLHMHPGSQIYKLLDIKNYFDEVKQVYEELKKMNFTALNIVDPGGGAAYPYYDTREGTEESPDYTIVEYFNELLTRLASFEPQPEVVFEGGRFIVSAHRVVVAKVVDVRPYSAVQSGEGVSASVVDEVDSYEDAEKVLHEVKAVISSLKKTGALDNDKRTLYENLVKLVREDLVHKLAELIGTGMLNCNELLKHKSLLRILTSPSKRYILNMSIFADVPDTVLVDQYFQVVPAQRLNEPPDVVATISDLTCDSMGELSLFISSVGNQLDKCIFTRYDSRLIAAPGFRLKLRGIPLHLPTKDESYYVAILDTGAYQDTLAMRHNLIYGAPEVIIDLDDKGEVNIRVIRHEELYT